MIVINNTIKYSKQKVRWNDEFAYALGLITSDGSLSKDGRHITFVSKDIDQIENFCTALHVSPRVGISNSGDKKSRTYRVQFSDVCLYRHLLSIGLMPNKSKRLTLLRLPRKYFFSFLLGYFDGDGSVYSYWDKRWRSSFMFYLSFACGSKEFLTWISKKTFEYCNLKGTVIEKKSGSIYELRFAKKESLQLIRLMFKSGINSLERKRLKIKEILCIIGKSTNIIDRSMRK